MTDPRQRNLPPPSPQQMDAMTRSQTEPLTVEEIERVEDKHSNDMGVLAVCAAARTWVEQFNYNKAPPLRAHAQAAPQTPEKIDWYPDGSAACPRCGDGIIWNDDDPANHAPTPTESHMESKEYWRERCQLFEYEHGVAYDACSKIECLDAGEKGRGVFAKLPIARGDVVEVSPVKPFNNSADLPIGLADLPFAWTDNQDAIALGLTQMANHSDSPSCMIERDYDNLTITLRAIRDIEVGEELSFQYRTLWFTPAEAPSPLEGDAGGGEVEKAMQQILAGDYDLVTDEEADAMDAPAESRELTPQERIRMEQTTAELNAEFDVLLAERKATESREEIHKQIAEMPTLFVKGAWHDRVTESREGDAGGELACDNNLPGAPLVATSPSPLEPPAHTTGESYQGAFGEMRWDDKQLCWANKAASPHLWPTPSPLEPQEDGELVGDLNKFAVEPYRIFVERHEEISRCCTRAAARLLSLRSEVETWRRLAETLEREKLDLRRVVEFWKDQHAQMHRVHEEARAEVERLKYEKKRILEDFTHPIEAASLRADRDALKADYAELIGTHNATHDRVKELAADRDALRAEVEQERCLHQQTADLALKDWKAIRADRDALREALEYYACRGDCTEVKLKDGSCIREQIGTCGKVARAALSPRTQTDPYCIYCGNHPCTCPKPVENDARTNPSQHHQRGHTQGTRSVR